jgi:L-2-hydroxyglutarate oxidase LhgO
MQALSEPGGERFLGQRSQGIHQRPQLGKLVPALGTTLQVFFQLCPLRRWKFPI